MTTTPIPKQVIEQIQRLRAKGLPFREIARQARVNVSTAWKYCKDLSIGKRRN